MTYCAGLGKALIVFDNPLAQPQWKPCTRNEFDLLIGPAEVGCASVMERFGHLQQSITTSDPTTSSSSCRGSSSGDKAEACRMCLIPCKRPIKASIDDDNLEANHETWQTSSSYFSSTSADVKKTRGRQKRSHLTSKASSSEELVKTCRKCDRLYHSYCMPLSLLTKDIYGSDISLFKDTCWSCLVCKCGKSFMQVNLLPWNFARIDNRAPDQPQLVCGGCLKQYKVDKQFCPVCYGIYSDDIVDIEPQEDYLQPLRMPINSSSSPSSSSSSSHPVEAAPVFREVSIKYPSDESQLPPLVSTLDLTNLSPPPRDITPFDGDGSGLYGDSAVSGLAALSTQAVGKVKGRKGKKATLAAASASQHNSSDPSLNSDILEDSKLLLSLITLNTDPNTDEHPPSLGTPGKASPRRSSPGKPSSPPSREKLLLGASPPQSLLNTSAAQMDSRMVSSPVVLYLFEQDGWLLELCDTVYLLNLSNPCHDYISYFIDLLQCVYPLGPRAMRGPR